MRNYSGGGPLATIGWSTAASTAITTGAIEGTSMEFVLKGIFDYAV